MVKKIQKWKSGLKTREMPHLSISEKQLKIENIEKDLPRWEGMHYGEILKIEIKVMKAEIQSIKERERDIKENPDLWGG